MVLEADSLDINRRRRLNRNFLVPPKSGKAGADVCRDITEKKKNVSIYCLGLFERYGYREQQLIREMKL